MDELNLNDSPSIESGELREVHGVFFGCRLLYPGWWARAPLVHRPRAGGGEGFREIAGIRQWLNEGFHLWGPSWDLSARLPTEPANESHLSMFGQLGENDEANSIPVVVMPRQTMVVRDRMASESALAIEAKVTGRLFSGHQGIEYLGGPMRQALRELLNRGGTPYYLLVSDEEKCDILPVPKKERKAKIYSAYLWHWLVRENDEAEATAGTIKLGKTLWVWEHTNLLSKEALRFNFDSLIAKREWLAKRLGTGLKVMQQSYSVEDFIGEKSERIGPLVPTTVLSKVLAMARESARNPS